jgi:hypothetical protein
MPKILSAAQTRGAIAALTAIAVVATPVIVMADASNPTAVRHHHAKPKMKKHRRAAVRPVARAATPAPEPVVRAPEPQVVEAPPAPEAPAPVAEAAPAAAAPAAAPVMASKGGSGLLLGLLGAAAVVGAIVAASSGGNNSPASP